MPAHQSDSSLKERTGADDAETKPKAKTKTKAKAKTKTKVKAKAKRKTATKAKAKPAAKPTVEDKGELIDTTAEEKVVSLQQAAAE